MRHSAPAESVFKFNSVVGGGDMVSLFLLLTKNSTTTYIVSFYNIASSTVYPLNLSSADTRYNAHHFHVGQ